MKKQILSLVVLLVALTASDYDRGSGAFQGYSVTAGLVPRNSTYNELNGKFLAADYVSGNIWSIERHIVQQKDQHIGSTFRRSWLFRPPLFRVLVAFCNNAAKTVNGFCLNLLRPYPSRDHGQS